MRDSVAVIHRNTQGSPDYIIVLTFEFSQEEGQWVGLCLELGTSAFSDSLGQARLELQEAVEFQLNGVERFTDMWVYLLKNHVLVVPIEASVSSAPVGFAFAGESQQSP